MQILFVTTHNLATNPRLVKEVEVALDMGHTVTIICFHFGNWSLSLNNRLKEKLDACRIIELSGDRKPFFKWMLSAIIHKVASYLLKINPDNFQWQSFSIEKRSVLLLNALKKLDSPFELVIAHNPGSFYPSYIFSNKHNIPLGIDIEDYHPGETTDTRRFKILQGQIKKIITKSSWFTAASPMILKQTLADSGACWQPSICILNCFPQGEFEQPSARLDGRLKLVWFSQYIAEGRGLEFLLPLIKKYECNVELHLYGKMEDVFREKWLQESSNIYTHKPQIQEELHRNLAKYDIGVAIEDKSANLNRDLCLTNKIIAYFQAGLYILASNTQAQQAFINDNEMHGVISELNQADLKLKLEILISKKEQLRESRMVRYSNAKTISWENEQQKLKRLWQQSVICK